MAFNMDIPGLATVLQARMGSTRLPGKVLRDLCGRSMLDWIADRLSHLQVPLILATTVKQEDDVLVQWASMRNLHYFRGSEADVLDRYYQCACAFHLKHVIRATGDNPFVDVEEGLRLIEFYLNSRCDYASSCPEFGSGLPRGVGLEIMGIEALRRSWKEGQCPNHREHVNEYIHENPDRFTISALKALPQNQSNTLSLTVDTLEEFSRAAGYYSWYQKTVGESLVPVSWIIRFAEAQKK